MTVKQILSDLESLGDEKRKAHNVKHGISADLQFGVKMGDIRKVAKKYKKAEKNVAIELWNTRILEAQLISTLLIKPEKLSIEELNSLVETISFDYVADWFNSYIANKHPEKDKLLENWLKSDNKWALRSAGSLLASKITKDAKDLNLGKLLDQIETEMPVAPQEVQWTMNFALAYIGIHHAEHRQKAIEIGNKLGIYKDYPVPRGCTSPFAPIWIEEMVNRQK